MNIYNVAVGYLLSNVWRLTSCRFQPHCLTSVYVEMMLCIKEDSGELWLAGVLDWQLPPFVLLREDKDQIKIRGSAASPAMVEGAFFSSFFVKVKGCNWLPDHAHVCWGGQTCREETVTDLCNSNEDFIYIVDYLNCIQRYERVGRRICCRQLVGINAKGPKT